MHTNRIFLLITRQRAGPRLTLHLSHSHENYGEVVVVAAAWKRVPSWDKVQQLFDQVTFRRKHAACVSVLNSREANYAARYVGSWLVPYQRCVNFHRRPAAHLSPCHVNPQERRMRQFSTNYLHVNTHQHFLPNHTPRLRVRSSVMWGFVILTSKVGRIRRSQVAIPIWMLPLLPSFSRGAYLEYLILLALFEVAGKGRKNGEPGRRGLWKLPGNLAWRGVVVCGVARFLSDLLEGKRSLDMLSFFFSWSA